MTAEIMFGCVCRCWLLEMACMEYDGLRLLLRKIQRWALMALPLPIIHFPHLKWPRKKSNVCWRIAVVGNRNGVYKVPWCVSFSVEISKPII